MRTRYTPPLRVKTVRLPSLIPPVTRRLPLCVPAVTGFLISGVALPVLAIIAIALSGQDIRALAARAGTVF
ncbi:MAG: branched-chain amino acid transport system II carrier protein, partial [Rothia aeria]